MPTWPAKTNYATGDVLTAAQMQDIGNALNSVESAQYAAGKNKIINGDFRFNQRSFTSTTTNGAYGFDRFFLTGVDGTSTYSAQTFTPGTAPVVGYEGINFARLVSTGQTLPSALTILVQRIEDVRTFANQTVTVSFWAKTTTGTPKIAVELTQRFGTGGSPSANVNNYGGQVTLSTSWERYSVTMSLPSISGKTIGTNNDNNLSLNLWISAGSDANSRTGSLGIQSTTIDFWGVQVEAGSSATPFQTATGNPASELAACQRYYYASGIANLWGGNTTSGSTYYLTVPFKVNMRIAPTVVFTSQGSTSFASGAPTSSDIRTTEMWVGNAANATASGSFYQFYFTASSEL